MEVEGITGVAKPAMRDSPRAWNLLGRVGTALDVAAAVWMVILGVLITVDVIGRGAFKSPVVGTPELVRNSVVAIAFLQMPNAVRTGSMLRTTVLLDRVSETKRRALNVLAYLLGVVFFAGVLISEWQPMLTGWRLLEYEGEGALRVPTYPVRTLIVVACGASLIAYLALIVEEIRLLASASQKGGESGKFGGRKSC